jgi:hypothetical protein
MQPWQHSTERARQQSNNQPRTAEGGVVAGYQQQLKSASVKLQRQGGLKQRKPVGTVCKDDFMAGTLPITQRENRQGEVPAG